jgi:hypothetical protein
MDLIVNNVRRIIAPPVDIAAAGGRPSKWVGPADHSA